MMIIYPAVDIKDGRCVMLRQGDIGEAAVYHDSPALAALRWQEMGAERLHVVDLNGAFSGGPSNTEAIEELLVKVDIPVQLGGGIRDMQTVERLLGMAVDRIILGTAALKNRSFLKTVIERYPSRIVVGIDARDGQVAAEGWTRVSGVKALEFAREIEELGVKRVVYTDISRDGMLKGPNFEGIREMMDSVRMEVIASGGISSIDDIIKLKKAGVSGAIVGKALYTGDIDLKEALETLKEGD